MRILCSLALSPSNARALLPLARAAAEKGHEVLVVAPPEMAGVFDGEPIQVKPLFSDMAEIVLSLLEQQRIEFSPKDPFAPDVLLATACGPHVTDAYRQLLAVAEEFRPDLVLRSGVEFAGYLVAETLGIPQVTAPSGGGQYLEPKLALGELNQRRAELGLPASDTPEAIYANGRFDCMPPDYSFAAHDIPGTFAYQQPASIVRDETEPEWLKDIPVDRPLVVVSSTHVFASLMSSSVFPRILELFFGGPVAAQLSEGTEGAAPDPAAVVDALMQGDANPLNAVVEGLSAVDCTAVIATRGMPVNPDIIGGNVRLFHTIPQPLLLESAQLLFTHGGYNSVREAVRAGVPMAVQPELSDQLHNATRVEELGLGLRVPAVTADAVTETCARLLAEPRFAQQARRAQRHMLALPPVRAAVDHLVRLADRAPQR
ncbi:glycosyltransferase [Streptomyces coffeae]|uniref:Glycosyltransferase family 1 protein n=1 Tax=Streptomyces coffeae TaxID=621382 RepID=A0ABS1NRI9_9ACTN|nr:glycosyltransferase [Streptomyces coffeae]MBL1102643.1 glycosyltransferase family 1 protein [Streptomyces coffeae]